MHLYSVAWPALAIFRQSVQQCLARNVLAHPASDRLPVTVVPLSVALLVCNPRKVIAEHSQREERGDVVQITERRG